MDLPSEQLFRHYSIAEIRLATQNFSDRLVVGQGGFGKVYKGYVKTEKGSSSVVAIKRLDSMSDQGAPEFKAEIEMLSRLRHSNLVSLLGCCVDGKEMILVYEFMPHETVYHHLHKSNNTLSWIQRLRISIGAARGLDYLHTGAGTHHGVIHRDVKTSNILLDKDWAAKISDFGLAKVGPINQPRTYVNTCIKGTFGYLDPEMFLTGKLTRKTDVFAFGVVLFELLSGRHAVFPDEDLSLARWAQNCIKKRSFDQLVATEIKRTLSPKSLKEFAQIAYRCLHSDLKLRPTMSEVVVALQLSLALQEKSDIRAKQAGLVGFSWKLPNYFVFSTKENSGHKDKRLLRNNIEINNDLRSASADDGGDCNEQTDLKIFSYTDLRLATRNFQNEIITGGLWDVVFKGWVHEMTYSPSELDVGLAITVKDLGRNLEGKLQLLSEFSHRNLHRILGYCLEDGKLYIVHEFMEKRSLTDYLCEDVAAFSFVMRIKLAVGVANGLLFLQRKELIIKDWILDSDDIWIDKDYNAKLISFDVARLVNQLAQYPLTCSLSSWRRQCDANGLGMLLMEILTGLRVPDKRSMELMEPIYLSKNVAQMSHLEINNLFDPQIILNDPETERARELLSLILKCTRDDYTMEQASNELEQIYNRIREGK